MPDRFPAIRERLHDNPANRRSEAATNTSGLKRQIDKTHRDRKKWAEHDFDGTVPSDIAREKQEQLSRQLASLERELANLKQAGIDTNTTLDAVLDLLADPGQMYRHVSDVDRRHYNPGVVRSDLHRCHRGRSGRTDRSRVGANTVQSAAELCTPAHCGGLAGTRNGPRRVRFCLAPPSLS